MMIAEGIIAMVWAAGALAIYNLFPSFLTRNGTDTLSKITGFFLGEELGGITIVAVVILAVTSGDTALRCLRLSIAEALGISQSDRLAETAGEEPRHHTPSRPLYNLYRAVVHSLDEQGTRRTVRNRPSS